MDRSLLTEIEGTVQARLRFEARPVTVLAILERLLVTGAVDAKKVQDEFGTPRFAKREFVAEHILIATRIEILRLRAEGLPIPRLPCEEATDGMHR